MNFHKDVLVNIVHGVWFLRIFDVAVQLYPACSADGPAFLNVFVTKHESRFKIWDILSRFKNYSSQKFQDRHLKYSSFQLSQKEKKKVYIKVP